MIPDGLDFWKSLFHYMKLIILVQESCDGIEEVE